MTASPATSLPRRRKTRSTKPWNAHGTSAIDFVKSAPLPPHEFVRSSRPIRNAVSRNASSSWRANDGGSMHHGMPPRRRAWAAVHDDGDGVVVICGHDVEVAVAVHVGDVERIDRGGCIDGDAFGEIAGAVAA